MLFRSGLIELGGAKRNKLFCNQSLKWTMLKPDIEVVVSKGPLPTPLLLPTAKAVPGLPACGGLDPLKFLTPEWPAARHQAKTHWLSVNKFEPINWFRNKER